jgi:hypothetical protein
MLYFDSVNPGDRHSGCSQAKADVRIDTVHNERFPKTTDASKHLDDEDGSGLHRIGRLEELATRQRVSRLSQASVQSRSGHCRNIQSGRKHLAHGTQARIGVLIGQSSVLIQCQQISRALPFGEAQALIQRVSNAAIVPFLNHPRASVAARCQH